MIIASLCAGRGEAVSDAERGDGVPHVDLARHLLVHQRQASVRQGRARDDKRDELFFTPCGYANLACVGLFLECPQKSRTSARYMLVCASIHRGVWCVSLKEERKSYGRLDILGTRAIL